MKILVACEESQAVTKELRALGHEAYSNDIIECSGGHPEWHKQGDSLDIAYSEKWDMVIAFPPCTYLTVTGNRWYNVEKYGEAALKRHEHRAEAIEFFRKLYDLPVSKIAIENPVGIMSTHLRKPDQIINPYQFGDPYEKQTCLWLKGLPLLEPTDVVEPEPRVIYKSGKSHPAWYAKCASLTPDERAKMRSKTFPGIARAMATQWTK